MEGNNNVCLRLELDETDLEIKIEKACIKEAEYFVLDE